LAAIFPRRVAAPPLPVQAMEIPPCCSSLRRAPGVLPRPLLREFASDAQIYRVDPPSLLGRKLPRLFGTGERERSDPSLTILRREAGGTSQKLRLTRGGDPMNKRMRWLVVLSSIFLMVPLIAGLGMFSAGLRSRVQRLPDGTRLSLAGVTYGRQHQIVRGT